MFVDSHLCVWPHDVACGTKRDYLPLCGKSIEDVFEAQTRHGVAHGVLVKPCVLGVHDSYLFASLPVHAAWLVGVFGPERVVWARDYPWRRHEQGRS
ncbi:MAG: hypothetical protein AAF942_08505 [Pseudomonadota bacterium]